MAYRTHAEAGAPLQRPTGQSVWHLQQGEHDVLRRNKVDAMSPAFLHSNVSVSITQHF